MSRSSGIGGLGAATDARVAARQIRGLPRVAETAPVAVDVAGIASGLAGPLGALLGQADVVVLDDDEAGGRQVLAGA